MSFKENVKTLSDELRRRAVSKFPRRHITTLFPNQYFGADLVDMSNVKSKNQNITFLLNVVDLFSRYAWSIPLKSKTGREVCEALKSIGVCPENLWVDEGKEFYNSYVQGWCKDNNVHMYSTQSGLGVVFVERFNLTMRECFNRFFSEHLTTKFSGFLPIFLNQYNHRIHSSTKESPYDVYHGIKDSREALLDEPVDKHKFNVGDCVRVSKVRRTFQKGSSDRFTHEAFRVSSVDTSYSPVMYQLEDMAGEEITGKFYEQELTITKVPEFKLIESVLKRKKANGVDMVLVNYKGHSSKFDEWITKRDYDVFMKQKGLLSKNL
jgi:hypothetical protein